jgi:membrane-associated phospholipid phosphatase
VVVGVLVVVSLAAGTIVGFGVRRWPSADPAAAASGSVRRELADARRRGIVRARFDPSTATGLALTVASLCVVVGGVVLGVLLVLVRSRSGGLGVDVAVGDWAAAHATPLSSSFMRVITWLGSTQGVVVVALAVGLVEFRRIRSRSIWIFLPLVIGGQLLIVNLIKVGVARARPAIDPLAAFSGASFPSGHTAAAAACYAALALVWSRGRSARSRALAAGLAATIAVAVGMSRMLLGVHWFTDVIGGLAFGWAWVALCAIAVGGRLLRFGTTAVPLSSPGSGDGAVVRTPSEPRVGTP